MSNIDKNWEIYVVAVDGSATRRLTETEADDNNPAWSPCGDTIAFESLRDGNGEVYLMHADGSNQRNLTNDPAWDGQPAWMPTSCTQSTPNPGVTP